jgi:hypothetical protein
MPPNSKGAAFVFDPKVIFAANIKLIKPVFHCFTLPPPAIRTESDYHFFIVILKWLSLRWLVNKKSKLK